jgi:hypothetical protein
MNNCKAKLHCCSKINRTFFESNKFKFNITTYICFLSGCLLFLFGFIRQYYPQCSEPIAVIRLLVRNTPLKPFRNGVFLKASGWAVNELRDVIRGERAGMTRFQKRNKATPPVILQISNFFLLISENYSTFRMLNSKYPYV